MKNEKMTARFMAREIVEAGFDAEIGAEQYARILNGEAPERVVDGILKLAFAAVDDGGDGDIIIRLCPRGADGTPEEPAMEGYLLVTVFDQAISTKRFGTLRSAQEAMHREMLATGVVKEDYFESSDGRPLEWDEYYDSFAFYPDCGFVRSEDQSYAWNWKIVEL